MTNESTNPSSAIHDLVNCFLDRLSNAHEEQEGNNKLFKENLMHEIDSAISHYLDENAIPSIVFVELQQELINTVAQKLIEESSNEEGNGELNIDNEGNYSIEAVFEALETYNLNAIDSTLSNHDNLSHLNSEID